MSKHSKLYKSFILVFINQKGKMDKKKVIIIALLLVTMILSIVTIIINLNMSLDENNKSDQNSVVPLDSSQASVSLAVKENPNNKNNG